MKKNLLYILLLMFPLTALAQKETEVIKNFENDVENIVKTFRVNEHVNIMQVLKTNNKFDLIAINDQMQVLWKVTLKGYAFSSGKFKDKIIAIAAEDYSAANGPDNKYNGYLIDIATGKVLLQKEIFNDPDHFVDISSFLLDPKGDFFEIVVKQTGVSRNFFSVTRTDNKSAKIIKSVTIIDYNAQLEPTPYKANVQDGSLASITSNTYGDIFLGWLNRTTLIINKYTVGQQSGVKGSEIDLGLTDDKDETANSFKLFPSSSKRDEIYFTFMNVILNGAQLEVGNYNFFTGHNFIVKQLISKDTLKDLTETALYEKNNKNFRPYFWAPHSLYIKFAKEDNGNIIVALSEMYTGQEVQTMGNNGMVRTGNITTQEPSFRYVSESSTLIYGLDKNLNSKYKAVLPTGYTISGVIPLTVALHMDGQYLHIIGNQTQHSKLTTMYGKLNLATGKWDTMGWLNKDKIGNHGSFGYGACWFANCMITSFVAPANLLSKKLDILLKKYNYSSIIK